MNEDDTFDRLSREPTEDEKLFGYNKIVYCGQHLRPHFTGWCSVGNDQKIPLKAMTHEEAYAECKDKGLNVF